MQLVQNNDYVLFFGDADNACEPQLYKNETAISVLEQEPFVSFQKYNSTSAFLLLHQIHGSTGVVIESLDQAQEYVLYSQEGDFLVTNISGITLGVLTADCLPVVVIDTKNKNSYFFHHNPHCSPEHQIHSRSLNPTM